MNKHKFAKKFLHWSIGWIHPTKRYYFVLIGLQPTCVLKEGTDWDFNQYITIVIFNRQLVNISYDWGNHEKFTGWD